MHLLTLRKILVATDLTDTSLAAMQTARSLAEASGGELHVVHAGSANLARVLEHAGYDAHEARVHVVPGRPEAAIHTIALEVDANVIILGSRAAKDRTRQDALGGTAMSVVTNATTPCLVVGRPLTLPIEHVLVPVDLSDTARGALVVGLAWASALRPTRARASKPATLTAVYIYTSGSSAEASSALDAEFERIREDAGDWAGVVVERVVVSSNDVVESIAKHRADLTVLGTRGAGQNGGRRLGSVSAAVLRRTDAPVLLVPPAVWQRYASPEASLTAKPAEDRPRD